MYIANTVYSFSIPYNFSFLLRILISSTRISRIHKK